MPSNAEVYSMLALILVPCLVTAGLFIWHHQRKKRADPHYGLYKAANEPWEKPHDVAAFKRILDDWNKGVETRIQEMPDDDDLREAA
jgi:hypothetical protein